MATAQLTIRSTVLKMDVKVDVIIPESRRNYLDDRTLYSTFFMAAARTIRPG